MAETDVMLAQLSTLLVRAEPHCDALDFREISSRVATLVELPRPDTPMAQRELMRHGVGVFEDLAIAVKRHASHPRGTDPH
ncbi:hypothetical protein BKG82_27875 [Mycobacteroides chelonae]|uniref:Uncharacterized protein n=1 Tax=Mycobacteroides chelonae TaxID=1774 RepID=A0A1S1LIG5_MYCCH|nr:hypothetical protein [Mycobacteroides chelonae]OHU47132.1 hypothetical protein BKG82_26095 [Mycobacteroides chelonae]OHU47428.1 hypothetical protein BKG82_27875 [Mycobacteroides chelonae]